MGEKGEVAELTARVARLEERLAQLCNSLAQIARPTWDKRPEASATPDDQEEPQAAVDCLDAWLREIERRASDAESLARSVRGALSYSGNLSPGSAASRGGSHQGLMRGPKSPVGQ